MVNPLVSVVITTFNRPNFAKGAINNVLDQSYSNIEVIVVEDGSQSQIQSFVNQINSKKVRYVSHSKNQGLSASRNTGMKISKGQYIAFLDDDDRWHKDKIIMQMALIHKSVEPKMMVYCRNIGKKKSKFFPVKRQIVKGLMSEYIFQGFLLPSSSMLIDKNSLESIGGHSEDLISCIDHDIWMKMAEHGFYMDVVEEDLIYSVEAERERMVNQFDDRLKGIEQFFKKWKSQVVKKYGIENWMQIELIYHKQTSYSIIDRYRRGIISKHEGINYLRDLFLLQSRDFSWFDILIAKFGLKFSTRVLNFIPLQKSYL